MSELFFCASAPWLEWGTRIYQAMPLVVLLLASIPLFVLARRRIYPHVALLLAFLVPCMLSFIVLVHANLLALVVGIDLIVLGVAFADFFSIPRSQALSAERQVVRVASLNVKQQVVLTITNHSRRSLVMRVCDDLPQPFTATPSEFLIRLTGRSRATLKYDFVSSERGAFELNCVHIEARSVLGLWKRFLSPSVSSVIHVYPDMKQMAKYALLARANRLTLLGVRRTRKIGQDNDFERLRDYSLDDNFKHIDWRATARRRKLTVKDFQSSQSQRLIFMVDCGRMMTNESRGISLLDHALNATLMLAYVALRQGDSVGLICFSDEIHTFVPARSGMNQMNQLLHASFDRFPKLVESRYDLAFLHLASQCRKRSMVTMITNVIDEVNALQVSQYLSNLVGRHLPVGVLLRDHQLFDAADREDPAGRQLYEAAAAAEILSWRHHILNDLEHRGVLAMDLFPEDMAAPLINRYLEVKARHLL